MKDCVNCSSKIEIQSNEEDLLKKMGVDEPVLCFPCRDQRRMAFRNERSLYKDKCGLCGRKILSMYDPERGFKVFCSECYFGDGWNPEEYGLEVDLGRSFFEQFREVYDAAPKLNLYVKFSENCEYNNLSLHNKNCYLIFGSGYNEDCYNSTHVFHSQDCADMFFSEKCSECCQLIDSEGCYKTFYSVMARNCKESAFLFDCRRCEHCIGCWNLRDKKYHIFNKPVSEEEFEKYKATEFEELLEKIIGGAVHRDMVEEGSEGCSGNFIYNSKNARNAYAAYGCEDVCNLVMCLEQKDSADVMGTSHGVLAYDCLNNDWAHLTRFCMNSTYLDTCDYCDSCDRGKNLFGCVGLRHKDHYILNKKYEEKEWAEKVSQIVAGMKVRGEWGGFFPGEISPFCYNETVAQEYYPLDEDSVLKRGWKWKREGPKMTGVGAAECKKCGKGFNVVVQEEKLYRRLEIPLSGYCPGCRHKWRLSLRTPRRLWKGICSGCGGAIETSHAPGRKEKVYCRDCYLGMV